MPQPRASAIGALCGFLILAVCANCSSLANFFQPQTFAVRAMPLLSVLAPTMQEFFVDPAAESSVRGTAGTTLIFPKDAFKLPADYRVGGQVKVELREAMDTVGKRMAMIRRFPDVDRMGWWNFDLPKPGIVCLRASLSMPVNQKNLAYLSVIGVDYRGVYARWVDERNFEINAPATTRVRLLAVDERGLAGSTGVLTTWSRSGFQQAGNSRDPKRPEAGDSVQTQGSSCQEVGVISVTEVPKEVWSDPAAIRARFQL